MSLEVFKIKEEFIKMGMDVILLKDSYENVLSFGIYRDDRHDGYYSNYQITDWGWDMSSFDQVSRFYEGNIMLKGSLYIKGKPEDLIRHIYQHHFWINYENENEDEDVVGIISKVKNELNIITKKRVYSIKYNSSIIPILSKSFKIHKNLTLKADNHDKCL